MNAMVTKFENGAMITARVVMGEYTYERTIAAVGKRARWETYGPGSAGKPVRDKAFAAELDALVKAAP